MRNVCGVKQRVEWDCVKLAMYVACRVRQRVERGSVLSEIAYGMRQRVE